MKGCSKGRFQIATVIVVLCLCGAGLGTYFALRNIAGLNTRPPDGSTSDPVIWKEPNISFVPSKSSLYIGDKNLTMTCNVSNGEGIWKVDILHENDEAGAIEIIANITANSSYTNGRRVTIIEHEMNNDSAILRIVFVSALVCQDKGRYYCRSSGNRVSNETLEMELLRKPLKPTLILNRDIVEGKRNGMELPFTCEGDVGYPPGRLELGSNSTNYFFPIIMNQTTTVSNESCQTKQKITFYYTFSRLWHEKEIHCSAMNNKSLESSDVPPFDSQIVQVVPENYCQNRPDRSYYHPYNCSYYIDCINGSVNIKECPQQQCFGLNETSGCNVCEKATCALAVVASVCSKPNSGEIVPLSDVRCSMYVNCADKMAHECPGKECFNVKNNTCASWQPLPHCKEIVCSASGVNNIGQNGTVICPIGDIPVTSISVKVIPDRSEGWEMFYVTRISGLGVLQGNQEATLNLSGARPNQTLSIGLHPLLCHQIGQYIIKINNDTCGEINITDKAEVPFIDVSNTTKENETLDIRCRGNVGAPLKEVFLEVQFFGSTSFQTFSAKNTTNVTLKDCDNERETNFTITATLNWNNSVVRCSVRNEDNIMSSELRRISIVRQSISFELSKSSVYIGDENVSLTCKISHYAELRRVDILSEKEETGRTEVIATITTNSSYIDKSRMSLTEQKMNADSAILRTVFLSALVCQDKGRFYCIATGSRVSNETLQLYLLRKPLKPTLNLNKDIVEGKQNRLEEPFTCEGDLGYPPGRLELGSNSTDYFYPIIASINVTISNETCQAHQKTTFYYALSRRWHGKEIRCSAINSKSLGSDEIPPFDSHVVQVIPADYCQNRSHSSYFHPYNCSYYIDCINGSVNIKECPAAQCFGLNETIGCSICENAICAKDKVADACSKSTTGEIVPLSNLRCSMYINCTDKMVHECPGSECFNVSSSTCTSLLPPPSCKAMDCIVYGATTGQNATIVCPVGDVFVTSIAVTVAPERSGEWEMFYVTGVSRLGVLQGNNEVTLTLSGARLNQTLSIGLHPLQCRQIGQYIININTGLCGRIVVTDNAEVPNITMSNATHENRTLTIRCRGNVGAPAKHFLLEIQFVSSSFQTYSAENITNVTSNDCNNIRETNFTITVTQNLNNSLVRCSVRNEDNSVLSSEPRRINIVRPSVTLQPSKSVMYIGDKNFLMSCIVSNYIDLKRVELYQESEILGTIESIANITERSTPTYKSGVYWSDAVITPEYAFLRVTFTNPLTCTDGEKYLCVAVGNVTLNSSIRLVKARRPGKPILFLSRDLVEGKENQDQLPHTCEGNVGYPVGKLVLMSNFTNTFNPSITNMSTTVSNKTCEAYQKITFKYAFSRSWNGQELRCSVVNNESLGENETSPFDAKVVNIVSADTCMDRPDGHYYHRYNCSNFIYCVNRTVHIGECQRTACFGLNETDRCNVCSQTICVHDVIGQVCTSLNVNELVPYNMIRCSMYANCTDRMVYDCPRNECFDVVTKGCPRLLTGINCSASESTIGSNATILCTMGEVKVTSVSVKVTSGRNVELKIFNINVVNGSGVLSSSASASLTLSGTGSSQTLTIGLYPLQCQHIGLYSVNVNNEFGGEIRITDKAEKPNITIPAVNNENGTLELTCRGNVGAPAKEIFLEAQITGSSNFRMVTTDNKTNATLKDCDNDRETAFTIIATSNWNNTIIRCSVRNEDNSIQSSEQKRINIVPSNVKFEPSKRDVYIGDSDLSMTCNISNHQQLTRIELYQESAREGKRELIANITKQLQLKFRDGIDLQTAVIMADYATVKIRFTNSLTCNDDGMYYCVVIGSATFTASINLSIFSEPNDLTLILSPWIVENESTKADRMFRCEGMVGRPASNMFVEANISGSFKRHDFPAVITNTQVNCTTNQNYQFYYAFNMSWNGQNIRCAVTNLRNNITTWSLPKTIEVVRESYCAGKRDNYYPHPYECTKFIWCIKEKIIAISYCGAGLCFGMNQTTACTYCNNEFEDLICLQNARKY
ncbi:hypothetical protein CHS0354_041825 [Potamilus streckersoni]|uniref:Ig-like domain-containing protein n=1 Tax=Potamilus streckersoni TaxID=2493646 RepID=A0AAE0W552_9BIVA|nr:hypothetical protein CHS0354_041825 [Potamilus streckersoni]